MTAVAEQLDSERRRQFRRLLAVSAAVHVGAFTLLGITPSWNTRPAGPQVISVEMVAAPGQPALRPPPPKRAEPAAPPEPVEPLPPPPPVPVKKQVVLPKEPSAPKPEVKARPRPQRRELDPSELQRPAPTEDYEDVMAKLRAEAGEPSEATPPQPVETASVQPPSSAGSGQPVSPEVAAWMRRVKIHVRRSWVVEPGFRMQPLETRVSVRLDAGGTVLGEPRITRRSGNPWYDDNVVRALQKASPLPPPPEAGEWPFSFAPSDSY